MAGSDLMESVAQVELQEHGKSSSQSGQDELVPRSVSHRRFRLKVSKGDDEAPSGAGGQRQGTSTVQGLRTEYFVLGGI